MLGEIRKLSATSFENLTYDLLVSMGLQNAVWRTPGRDAGRDIEGEYPITDLSGYRQSQRWYVECKKYQRSVDWPTVREKLSFAESSGADYLLIVTTSSISPQGVDEINKWNTRYSRPKIRYWAGYCVVNLLQLRPHLLLKYRIVEPKLPAPPEPFLHLCLICLKFSDAAYARSVFTGIENPELEASAALTDLVTKRMNDPLSLCELIIEQITPDDIYPWLETDADLTSLHFDRYGFRAIISVFRVLTRSERVTLTHHDSTIRMGLSPDNAFSDIELHDLQEIAQWSQIEISVVENQMILNQRLF